jgi:CheY-like chemotaxis protein
VTAFFPGGVDVLVVDEDDSVRARVARGIRSTGCIVEEVRNGYEAAMVMKLWPVRTLVLGAQAPEIDELLDLAGPTHAPVVLRLSKPS